MASMGRVVLCLTCLAPSKVLEDGPREVSCPPRLTPGLGGLLGDSSLTPLFLCLWLESPGPRKLYSTMHQKVSVISALPRVP